MLKAPFSVHYQSVTVCAWVCLCQHVGGILFSCYTLHSSTFPLLGIVKIQRGSVIE